MKLLFSFFLLLSHLFSSQNIDSSCNFLGTVGKVNVSIIIEKNNNYKIVLKAHTTGATKVLSNNFSEVLISQGKYINSTFIPNLFKKVITTNNKIIKSSFIFNHKTKQIIHEKFVLQKVKNSITFDDEEEEDKDSYFWNISGNTTTLKMYSKDDILSLLFNISNYLKNNNLKNIPAIIGQNQENNILDIVIANKKESMKIKKQMDTTNLVAIVKTKNMIFSSKAAVIYVSINKDGTTSKIMLKE